MNSTLYPACALVAWLIVLVNARHLGSMRRNPARLAMWFMFLFFALAFTNGWSVIYNRVEGWTGLARTNVLISQLFVVCFSASTLMLLQLWTSRPSQARARISATLIGTGLVLTAMMVLFILSEGQHRQFPTYDGWYGGRGTQAAYLELYLTVFIVADTAILILCFRYGRLMTRCWMRTGLITTGFGAILGEAYCLTHFIGVFSARAGENPQHWENLAEVGAGGGALVMMLELTMHLWGPRVQRAFIRVRRIVTYARLRPLWSALYHRDPGIALDTPDSTSGHRGLKLRSLRDSDYHLARRVVEIRDGILALHPYLDQATADQVRDHYLRCTPRMHGPELGAAIEAARIHAALHTSRMSAKPDTPPARAEMNNAPGDLDAEAAWLTLVAKNFTRCQREPFLDLAPSNGADQ
jgi:hypothetical protein